jgi:hypothetical protein
MAWKANLPRRLHEAADVSELGDFEKFFKDLCPVELFVVSPAPSGGGYLVAGLQGVNRSFSELSADPRKLRFFGLRPCRGRLGSKLSRASRPGGRPLGTRTAS